MVLKCERTLMCATACVNCLVCIIAEVAQPLAVLSAQTLIYLAVTDEVQLRLFDKKNRNRKQKNCLL